jgi:hypothetical protein
MSVSCECCVLSGRGLCFGLIARPEESYRMCGVSECDSFDNEEALTHWGRSRHGRSIYITYA